jgi:hypothetical protein
MEVELNSIHQTANKPLIDFGSDPGYDSMEDLIGSLPPRMTDLRA